MVVDPTRALVSMAIGREVVRRVATALAPLRIPVMPLKGVWLQACVYAVDQPRVITDVDLLVPEAAFEPAAARLEREGFRKGSGNASERTLSHSDLPLPVDLHRRLFMRGAFRMPTAELFKRSSTDTAAFGIELQLPDPRDAFAHLLGHFVKSRTRPDDAVRLADFVAVAQACRLDPRDLALHLQRTGTARAARYALHELAHRDAHPFFVELIRELPADPLGDQLARAVRTLATGPLAGSRLARLSGFLLDSSLAAGVRALLLRAADLRHDRPPR